jgi:UDP-glucose 4-epimerase
MRENRTRVLVTGGAGFIGTHLVNRLLAEGYLVGVLDNMSTGTPANLAPCYAAGLAARDVLTVDVADAATVATIGAWAPEIIIHLAAQARVAASVAEVIEDARCNILGTIHVLEAALTAGVERVILASSGGTIYGELPETESGFTETATGAPISPYGVSKKTANAYAQLYGSLFGLRSVVLALGNVYGTRPDGRPCPDVIPQFITSILNGRAPVIRGDGAQTRDFIHVSDAVEAFRLACRAQLPDTTTFINIGSGVPTKVVDVLRMIGEYLHLPVPGEHVSALPYEVIRNCLRTETAGQRLGWRPSISLTAGIAQVITDVTGRERSASISDNGRVPA